MVEDIATQLWDRIKADLEDRSGLFHYGAVDSETQCEIDDAIRGIIRDRLQFTSQYVSVEDRLPGDPGSYIALFANGSASIQPLSFLLWAKESGLVTHWATWPANS